MFFFNLVEHKVRLFTNKQDFLTVLHLRSFKQFQNLSAETWAVQLKIWMNWPHADSWLNNGRALYHRFRYSYCTACLNPFTASISCDAIVAVWTVLDTSWDILKIVAFICMHRNIFLYSINRRLWGTSYFRKNKGTFHYFQGTREQTDWKI